MIGLILVALLLQSPNLEQQARASLDKADKALTDARAAYAKRELDATKTLLQELQTDMDTAQTSLAETGKNARRRPKQFKYGEQKTREMLRHLASFENDMDLDDRPLLEGAKSKVQDVHDIWLLGIMGPTR